MKKYTYIVLTTAITLSTTCMEKERKQPESLNIQSSLSIVRPANSSLYSMSTLNGLLQPNPFPAPVIQRKYTDLDITPVYVPINTNESSDTNDIELTPIYRPIKGSTTEYYNCITKTTHKTNSLTIAEKEVLINQLYQAASNLYISNSSDVEICDHQSLIKLISLMNKAKKNGIDEYYMGLFTYQQNSSFTSRTLYFNCLKKYNNTKEKLPFNADDLHTNPSLAQALGITCKYQYIEDITHKLESYPAYKEFVDMIIKVSGDLWSHKYYRLCVCIYSGEKTLFNDYPQYNDVTDFDSLYNHAYALLNLSNFHIFLYAVNNESIYNFLNLVEQIKKVEHISCVKDIYFKIHNFDPTKTFKGKCLNFIKSYYATVETKNYIFILYVLAEKYNQARGNKKTPTDKQYEAYLQQKELAVALPDDFNTTLFDENMYAFAEFAQLINNVKNITNNRSIDYIQQCVNQLYSQ